MLEKINNTYAKITPLWFFLFVISLFGPLFVFITPPFQGADEPVHFMRAYQISKANFVIDDINGNVGGFLPAAIRETLDITNKPAIEFYPQLKYDGQKTLKAFGINKDPADQQNYSFPSTAVYSPAAYISSSLGIFIMRLFDFPPIASLYIARIMNLLTWTVLLGAAINFMPRKKWALVFVGLLPMSLFQASTVNADAIAVGSGILFVAYILHIKDAKRQIKALDWLFLIVLGVLMALAKQVMFVLLPLVFLLPAARNVRSQLYSLNVVLIPIIALLGWFTIISHIDLSQHLGESIIPKSQLEFVMANPHSYINVLWNTTFYTWGDGVTRSLIGTFGWADAPLSELITTFGYISLFALLFVGVKKDSIEWLKPKEKILVLIVALTMWIAICTSLYLYYTPVGFKIVYGLQGRYFIPLLVLLIPLLYGNWIKTKDVYYKRIAIYSPLILLLSSSIVIYARYYINNV